MGGAEFRGREKSTPDTAELDSGLNRPGGGRFSCFTQMKNNAAERRYFPV